MTVMANKSGAIGTKAETASVKAIKTRGFPLAERKRPTGSSDCGDLTGTPGICWQVKGGKAAQNASDNQVLKWMEAAEKQRCNLGADLGILVLDRAGIGAPNAHMWWAVIPQWTLAYLHLMAQRDVTGAPGYAGSAGSFSIGASDPTTPWMQHPIRLHLGDLCALLVAAGYGEAKAA